MIIFTRILKFGSLGLFLQISQVWAAPMMMKGCGDYKVTGHLLLSAGKICTLRVWEGSLSAFDIQLNDCPAVYANYQDSTIQTLVRVATLGTTASVSGKSLEKIPLRALPNPSQSALLLEKKRPCQ